MVTADWLIYGVVGVAAVALVEALVLVRLSRSLAAVARFGERIAHLTSALELLTDTTEAGLTNVARELERSTDTRATRSTRTATARRITTAARRGQAPGQIAAAEGMSESEVSLHLQLARAGSATKPSRRSEGERHGEMRG